MEDVWINAEEYKFLKEQRQITHEEAIKNMPTGFSEFLAQLDLLNEPTEEEKQRQKEWVKKMVSEIDEDSRKELIWKRLEKYKKNNANRDSTIND